ncbi:MAG: ABC-2 family transporter protein, partial [Patescibacteria group bacterium]
MFLHELPWRLVQGFFGVVVLLTVYLWLAHFSLVSSWLQFALVLLVVLIGYLLTFIFKMIIGITSFWVTDFSGIHNLEAIVFLLLGGFVMPLDLLPEGLKSMALIQPVAYMIYYPVRAMQGYFDLPTLGRIAVTQFVWLLVLLTIYKRLWTAGVKRFTGVGQ